ncbi:hypothetical protein evm_006515 [Chilo suppressalis]|nr:hypothetical protein evm_006515 [Chilo suppressalis]
MPDKCAVPLCSYIVGGGHYFPKDSNVLEQWLKAIRRENFYPSNYSRICRKHFQPKDYMIPMNLCPRLKQGAVPSRFPWDKDWVENEATRRKREMRIYQRQKKQEFSLENKLQKNKRIYWIEMKPKTKMKAGVDHENTLRIGGGPNKLVSSSKLDQRLQSIIGKALKGLHTVGVTFPIKDTTPSSSLKVSDRTSLSNPSTCTQPMEEEGLDDTIYDETRPQIPLAADIQTISVLRPSNPSAFCTQTRNPIESFLENKIKGECVNDTLQNAILPQTLPVPAQSTCIFTPSASIRTQPRNPIGSFLEVNIKEEWRDDALNAPLLQTPVSAQSTFIQHPSCPSSSTQPSNPIEILPEEKIKEEQVIQDAPLPQNKECYVDNNIPTLVQPTISDDLEMRKSQNLEDGIPKWARQLEDRRIAAEKRINLRINSLAEKVEKITNILEEIAKNTRRDR